MSAGAVCCCQDGAAHASSQPAHSSSAMEQQATTTTADPGFCSWDLVPDDVWAVVLSKCTWPGAWEQVRPLLLWRPCAGKALQNRPQLLVQAVMGQGKRDSLIAFYHARQHGRVDVGAYLLTTGQLPRSVGQLLQDSAISGHLGFVNMLLENKPQSDDAWSKDAGRALVLAAWGGHIAVVTALLDAGMPVSSIGQAMADAASGGHVGTVQLLLKRGGELVHGPSACPVASAAFENGKRKALGDAAWYGHTPVVQLMFDHGTEWDDARQYVFNITISRGNEEVVSLLLRHGLPMAQIDAEMALEEAVSGGHMGIVRLLAAHGCPTTRAVAQRYLIVHQIEGSSVVTCTDKYVRCMARRAPWAFIGILIGAIIGSLIFAGCFCR